MNDTLDSSIATAAPDGLAPLRTSAILRGILTQNPGVKTFSVERILASIGPERFEASLMVFSIPAIVPVSAQWGLVTLPTGAIGCQLAAGQKRIQLPRFILKKCVSRKALAVAIHAILPLLEAAEKISKPRWRWVNHASARRAIGLFVFLLAIAIAYPLFGFNPMHATSIFLMALGMAEQDGLAVMVGVVVGMLSLAVLAASGMSARALRSKAGNYLRKIGRKLGLQVLARFLKRKGYPRLARLVTLEWSDLLLLWDPEKRRAKRLPATRALGSARTSRGALPIPSPRAA